MKTPLCLESSNSGYVLAMCRGRIACLGFSLLFVLVACGNTAAPASAPAVDVDFGALDVALEEWSQNVPGGAVGLVRLADGQMHLFDVGEDASSGEPLSASDRVRVGSISKVYTATLVLQLVDDGLVELDEPVGTYLPGTSVSNAITVRHVLAHQSGIPNYTEVPQLIEASIDTPTLQFEPETIVDFVADDSDFSPGDRFSYSNTNFIVAGQIVEAVTGETLEEAFQSQIAEPLELVDTSFDDGSVGDVASGYSLALIEGNSGSRNYQSIAELAWAAGSLVTTVEELAVFLDALLVEERLISSDSLEAMIGNVPAGGDYGLGLAPGTDFGLGHGGSIFGFNSDAQLDPETGEMVIVVVNNDIRRPSIATELITDFVGIE